MTSESLRSQVEKRIAEPLVTPNDVLTWRIEWWDNSGIDKTISQFMADRINTKVKARDKQVLTLIDEMAKELKEPRDEAKKEWESLEKQKQTGPYFQTSEEFRLVKKGITLTYDHALTLLVGNQKDGESR